MKKLLKEIKDFQIWFNSELRNELKINFKNKKPVSIYKAVKYALLNGGKRLRPFLLTKTAELFGLNRNDIKYCAMGIEMLHTYSLVHDDLPSLDDDDSRRGKLTVHKKFNEAMGVLTGDALLTMSFEYFTKAKSKKIKHDKLIEAINYFSVQTGADGMIGGQVADMENENKNPEKKTVEFIHSKKTVALLAASIKLGGILGNAASKEIMILENFGKNFGHAFQISDDILNITGSTKKLGKSVGSDEKKGKMTYIRLFGLEKTKKLCYNYVEQAKKEIRKLKNKDIKFFEDLSEYLLHRDR